MTAALDGLTLVGFALEDEDVGKCLFLYALSTPASSCSVVRLLLLKSWCLTHTLYAFR